MKYVNSFDEFTLKNTKFDDIPFEDFKLSLIPYKELKTQYVKFSDKHIPMTIDDPLIESCKQNRLLEGIKSTFDIFETKEFISRKYNLNDWQFQIKMFANDIYVGIVIPHIDNNEKIVCEDMTSLGYYETKRWTDDIDGLTYTFIRFDPKYPKDITDVVSDMNIIYHVSPKYNLESIKKFGFIPKHENTLFKYPPKIHFIKGNVSKSNIEHLIKQLNNENKNPKNNGEYILFTIDVSKIPDNVKFIGDSCYKYGICTEDKVPYDSVISTKEINVKDLK